MFKLLLNVLKNLINSPLIVLVLLILLLLSLQLISSATVDSKLFGQIYYILLVINIVTLLLFIVLISQQSWRLYKQYKNKIPGSSLTLRMVFIFVVLVILPTTILYFFSLQFIQRSIDSWFDKTVQLALEDAMKLSKSSVDETKKNHLKQIKRLVEEIELSSSALTVLTLSDIREKSGAEEVSLLTDKGKLIASTSESEGNIVPDLPGIELLLPLQQGRDHVHVDLEDNRSIRVLVRMEMDTSNNYLVLQASYPINKRQRDLTKSVQQAYTEYSELIYLRKPLKDSFIMTLSLVLLLGLLSTIWATFVFARRLSAPIRDLSEGTKAVAEGNYHKPIPLLDSGDLGQLVQSFNKMTRQLAKTHSQLQKSNAHSESQRAYLQIVLSSLTSGVLSINKDKKIQTFNYEASQILGVDQKKYIGFHIQDISLNHSHLKSLIEKIITFAESGLKRWQEDVSIREKLVSKMIILRGNILPDRGCVVVLEDVTTLIKAQKDAAWGEVARRLAHEIKNPLTPIQLSAERISHKFLKKMEPADREILSRLTTTIVHQVDNMKEMVKAFTEYARLPELKISRIKLSDLILEVIAMYGNIRDLKLNTEFFDSGISIDADQGKIRQVLHNLIKNSIEAMHDKSAKEILIKTYQINPENFVELSVEDNAGGIKEVLLNNIFDPYVTEKSKGSGLGLAIVKKIIEEHGGTIRVENIYLQQQSIGSRFIFSLPVKI